MEDLDESLKLEDQKKFVRLCVPIDFSFIFSLNLVGNEVEADSIKKSDFNVDKYFKYFLVELEKKLKKLDTGIARLVDAEFGWSINYKEGDKRRKVQ